MGKLYKENWYKKWQKKQIWAISRSWTGTGTGLYQYTPTRSQPVPVQVQPVPVHPNRMEPVPVQVKGVPVQVCPKCPECCIFVYLSLNPYSVSIGTLLNELR